MNSIYRSPEQIAAEIMARPGVRERYLAATRGVGTKKVDADLSNVWSQNPFSLRHRNFTKQCQIIRSDPKLAEKLKAEAARIDAAL